MDQNRNDNDLFNNFDNPPPQPPSGGSVPPSTPPSGGARIYDTPESSRPAETPAYTPPPPYSAPPPPAAQPPKRNNTIWIVAIVVVLLLCCCCLALAGIWLWNNGDAILQDMEFNLLPLVQMI